MPAVVIEAWQNIWSMTSQDLGGERRYHSDFEIHDERTHNLEKAVVDIYIGIR